MSLEAKRLTENELEILMKWRMNPAISRTLFSDVKLTLEGQKKWFERIKDSNKEIRWIVWNDGRPIGEMHINGIDYENLYCESGWFLVDKQGMDLKRTMALQFNLQDYAYEVLGMNKMYGQVLDDNYHLIRMLKMLGGEVEGCLKGHLRKNGSFHDVYIVASSKESVKAFRGKNNITFEKILME